MNTFTKQASEKFTISIDFSESLGDSETISSVLVSAVNSSGTTATTTVIDSSSISGESITVVVKAGTAGEKYTITVKITTSAGNILEEDVLMWVYANVDMILKVKTALRISTTTTVYDEEIMDLILAAYADLGISGIISEKIVETDGFIVRAVLLYCKTNFGFSNPDYDKLVQSYNMIKIHLASSRDYCFYPIIFTITNSGSTAIREAEINLWNDELNFDETKATDENGQAVFYVRSGANYKYDITADDYQDDFHSYDYPNIKDVTAGTTIDVTLTGV